jgi:hypothetical protein
MVNMTTIENKMEKKIMEENMENDEDLFVILKETLYSFYNHKILSKTITLKVQQCPSCWMC